MLSGTDYCNQYFTPAISRGGRVCIIFIYRYAVRSQPHTLTLPHLQSGEWEFHGIFLLPVPSSARILSPDIILSPSVCQLGSQTLITLRQWYFLVPQLPKGGQEKILPPPESRNNFPSHALCTVPSGASAAVLVPAGTILVIQYCGNIAGLHPIYMYW